MIPIKDNIFESFKMSNIIPNNLKLVIWVTLFRIM